MKQEEAVILGLVALASAVAGFGKALVAGDGTWRLLVGKSITSAALGCAAFVVLGVIPDASNLFIAGLAMLFVTFGTDKLYELLKDKL